ncbi:uncharacterized protein LOC116029851 [Ipomoea triloba]|uniref:uncharacterized protein LOC116029851 n=1 Tax=Ipomoea triloba TaxID=35885 RepID=UPI00125E63D0|nr:uncharacterized protein LOC116029851 [Ipomoea triloba]XP_031127757.1 uncharacterized protein LOC116029851 [Ipomoea triloba]
MVKSKAQSKKQQKRGVDFKKIRRKVGRKLPPPKNSTNTEIKSKAIVLPEQSVSLEKAGLAVSKKGLTLKELLQQTSHHNARVRKDALVGIKDIFLKYPVELKLHKLAVIEKLRGRISDDDKLVRETLYQLFKSVIFPGCVEDGKGPFISLIMVYIFSAMTNLAIEVRLMAFKFLDLVIQNYPSTFSMYAEKILQNYGDILQKNKFFLQDKGKLKTALSGLVRCLSLLPFKNRSADDHSDKKDIPVQVTLHAFVPDISSDSSGLSSSGVVEKLKNLLPALVSCFQDFSPLVHTMPQIDTQSYDCMLLILQNIDLLVRFFIHESPYHHTHVNISDQRISLLALKKLWDEFPFSPIHDLSKKENDRYFMLNIVITEIFLKISHWDHPPPALMEKFLEFIEISLSEKICHQMESSKVIHEKPLLALVSFTPELIMRVSGFWKSRILQAFTKVFKSCSPESLMKLACLSAIEEMMFSEHDWLYLDTSDLELLHYQITWIRELPSLLIVLGDKHPLSSKTVLSLQLRIGQTAEFDSPFAKEYDEMQYILRGFYSTTCDEGGVSYGPFMTLSGDIQELSLCCLYYFSILDSIILQSLVSCCLSHELEPCLVLRILEVLHTAYKAGHIQIADYISFLITLVSRFHAYPENHEGKSIRASFRSLTSAVCSGLSQIGDNCLIFQMVERVITDQIFLSPPVDNMNALLRILTAIDTAPTKLSEPSIDKLSHVLPKYLLDVASDLPGEVNEQNSRSSLKRSQYYLLPCFFLFQRSKGLLSKVLKEMGSVLAENRSPPLSYHHEFSLINHKSTLVASVSVLLLLHSDIKMRRVLSSCKPEIESILEYMVALLASEGNNMTIEERHEVQRACDRLTTATTTLLV